MINRADALKRLESEEFDVLVIGGGITGAGVALDAASRGYTAALIEKTDFAAGTSSRSSKLIHGGLRYLENFDLGLVREALLERQINVALAPHLVKPLQMVVPAFDGPRPDRMLGIGLNMYDVMAVERGRRPGLKRWRTRGEKGQAEAAANDTGRSGGAKPQYSNGQSDWSPARHRLINGDEVTKLIPALTSRAPQGGYLFYDCQTDDVRLVLSILGEAERFGTVMSNRVYVDSLVEENGKAVAASVTDTLSDTAFTIRAANIVNATGVWADLLRPDELHDEAEGPVIRPSRGTHILIDRNKVPLNAGVIARGSGKHTIFVLPWLGRTLIGTTDNDYEGGLDHIQPGEDDIEYLLKTTNEFFDVELDRDDIEGAYAGVRPLISTGDPKKSVDISRRAELYETSSGMVTITGGKLTTWRRMAKMTVDRLVERDGREAPCQTESIPLGMPIEAADLPQVEGVTQETYTHLAARYGYSAHEVIALAKADSNLAHRILPDFPDLLAEVAFAVRHEQAQTIADVLLRRTRLAILAARAICSPDSDVLDRVVDVMAAELRWSDERRDQELADFLTTASAEGVVVSVRA